MRNVLELLILNHRAYVYTSSRAVRQRFVRDLESEGFTFGDGAKPSERDFDGIMAVNPDMTINFVNFAGTMHFGSMKKEQWRYTGKEPEGDTIVRVDYARFLSGAEDYFILNSPAQSRVSKLKRMLFRG